MNIPRIRLSLGQPPENGRRLDAASEHDERARPSAAEVPPAAAPDLHRNPGIDVSRGRDQPRKPAVIGIWPWTFFILGMLWYALAWWALG